MKKILLTVALFTVLGTMAVSCQKDLATNQATIVSEQTKVYMVCYTVDGVTHQITLLGEDSWHDFLDYMFALAEEGHSVSFRKVENSNQMNSAKETIKYETKIRSDAYSWAEDMQEQGYSVTIDYDSSTGIYTCYATKP